MKCIWKRKSRVTSNFDPTIVVNWSCEELGIEITEFQNVYVTTCSGNFPIADEVGEELHKALEGRYQAEEEYKEFMSDTGLEPGI